MNKKCRCFKCEVPIIDNTESDEEALFWKQSHNILLELKKKGHQYPYQSEEFQEVMRKCNEAYRRYEKLYDLETINLKFYDREDGPEYDDGFFNKQSVVIECKWCKAKQWIPGLTTDPLPDYGMEWEGIGLGISIE